jgi:hypothetical protein
VRFVVDSVALGQDIRMLVLPLPILFPPPASHSVGHPMVGRSIVSILAASLNNQIDNNCKLIMCEVADWIHLRKDGSSSGH